MTINAEPPEHEDPSSAMIKVVRQAQAIARQLNVCEPALAKQMVDMLNTAAVHTSLVDRTVTVNSKVIQWQIEALDPVLGKYVPQPAEGMPVDGEYQGIFAGFDSISVESGDVLMYRVEIPSAESKTAFFVANSPVLESTRFTIDQTDQEIRRSVRERDEKVIRDLERHDNAFLTEDVTTFMEIYERMGRRPDSASLAQLGGMTTQILSYMELLDDTQAMQALLDLIGMLVDPKLTYYVEGHFRRHTDDSLALRNGSYRLFDAAYIYDYDVLIDTRTGKRMTTTSQFLHPSFIAEDSEGNSYNVPLRYIVDFIDPAAAEDCYGFNQQNWLEVVASNQA